MGHLSAFDHGGMDLAPAPYLIRINGHLGATVLSAFAAMDPQRHGAHTVLTDLLATHTELTAEGHRHPKPAVKQITLGALVRMPVRKGCLRPTFR